MANTLGELRTDINDWLEETLPVSRVNGAINNGIESLWSTLIRASVSMFVGGPISLSLTSGTEGVILISVADPTGALTLSSATSGALDAHSIFAKYTLVTESGTETLPSAAASLAVNALDVGVVESPAFVSGSIGWNCYGYSTLGSTTTYAKQNDTPILFGTDYQEPDDGFVNGPEYPLVPTENTTGDDICYIRHLECQMPDLGYKQYDAADISSVLMRKVSRNISTTSQYQNYYWDLINQRQLEFRPALGVDLAPRYFYVKRPRRLRFDNSPLPFLTVPCTEFLQAYAMARLSISIREYDASKAWDEVAERERTRCELLVNDMNHVKNQFITPYL